MCVGEVLWCSHSSSVEEGVWVWKRHLWGRKEFPLGMIQRSMCRWARSRGSRKRVLISECKCYLGSMVWIS